MIKQRFLDSLHHIKRDALAGSVAGIMAVPLTVGICLMSDYPVMTGLYTVIFATIISYLSYLIRPGNFVGTPGVAAGLAPALALGVSEFGMENMPFVILLTALFQMLVWKFNGERYILKLVPHYLVEGLLAGVGLKIALKFVPFLYDIQNESTEWMSFEREMILILSAVSLISFVLLYRYYQKKMPAMPYILIMATGFGLTFFMPLPLLHIDEVPFQLGIPIPDFGGLNGQESSFMILKMVGFAFMLGTIDVIEQVMSNVAIEKLDPLGRKCNSNNSLQSMWISNLGATFFGGMTNLDGLAKSTTNAVAGAVTKFSNLFTSLVLFLVVIFPEILSYIPEYVLGIIMIYSGWKMIANIGHVRAEGRYALIMAVVCGLLVFKFGIFEGLLTVLFGHAIIQFVFLKRLGKSNKTILRQFKASFSDEKVQEAIEMEDLLTEKDIPVFTKWMKAINNKDLNMLNKLYTSESTLVPAFSTRIRFNIDEILHYYRDLFSKDGVRIEKLDMHSQQSKNQKIDSGHINIYWKNGANEVKHTVRFTMIIKAGRIISNHTSILPTENASIALWAENQEQGNEDFIF